MVKGWKYARLDELTDDDSPITYGVVKPGEPGDVLFVRGGDIDNGRIKIEQLRTISKQVSDQYRRTLLRGGELLMCLVGQPGQVAVAPAALAGANIARQVGLIRLKALILPEFARFYLQSPEGIASLGGHTGGSVQQVINLSDLRTIAIPVPSLNEQADIVATLQNAQAELARARRATELKLAALKELEGAVLRDAFPNRKQS